MLRGYEGGRKRPLENANDCAEFRNPPQTEITICLVKENGLHRTMSTIIVGIILWKRLSAISEWCN